MKVRDVVADSVFTPGAARDSAEPPRVTVILPTFRRGDSGFLKRTIDSLLGQSFGDFELIIIDDASIDSSAGVIADAMKRDPRISLIRHSRNIGLPAISEYEAYLLARAPLIAFAFDDTVFHRHGLRSLVSESDRYPDTVIAGHVVAYLRTPSGELFSQPLGLGADEAGLLSGNVMPNSAVLAPKSVLDQVGLYDPHISLARLCDYDLWLRVRRRFPIRFVAACIGEEHGPSTSDSLGHTYPLDQWASDDRMRQSRNHLLAPERFGDLDVFDLGPFESARSRAVVADQTERHLATRDWMTAPAEPKRPASRVPRILVIAVGIDASTQLPFEGLRDIPDVHVRIIDPTLRPVSQVAEADALIVVNRLRLSTQWIQIARALGIPVFSYFATNLPLMATRDELDRELSTEFSRESLLMDLTSVDGILTSTERLAESVRSQGLHDSVSGIRLTAPRVLSEWTRPGTTDHPLPTLALFLGQHPLDEVGRVLWPALVETSKVTGERLRLLVPSSSIDGFTRLPGRDRVDVVPFAASLDYFATLRTLNELGTDVVLVPATHSANAEFESLHPLLTAAALNASLVAPKSDPYRELDDKRGLTLVASEATVADWVAALSDVVSPIGKVPRKQRAVPSETLSTRFDPARGAVQLIDAIGSRLPKTELDESARLRQITDWTATQLTLNRLGHSFGSASADIGTAALVTDMHTTLRLSRQLHALRGRSRQIPGLEFDAPPELVTEVRRGERIELSQPLLGVSYVSYSMRIEPGKYRRVLAAIWADGLPGDEVGIEIVDPDGQIRLTAVTKLPHDGLPVTVSFDARKLKIDHNEPHDVRVFARTSRLAFVLQRVDRGRLGLRRPRVSPIMRFEH